MLRDVRTESIMDLQSDFKSRCIKKVNYHIIQARTASLWSGSLKIIKLILTSSNILTLSLLTVFERPSYELAITGSAFSFAVSITDYILSLYNFDLLCANNYNASDEYKAILLDLEMALLDNNHDHTLLERFILLESKHHIVELKNCPASCMYRY